jgi:hypothetical protein
MKAGNIVLVDFPQSDGRSKLRPVLILKLLPKYNDFLVCGISTQLNQYIKDFDETFVVFNELKNVQVHDNGLAAACCHPISQSIFLNTIQNRCCHDCGNMLR